LVAHEQRIPVRHDARERDFIEMCSQLHLASPFDLHEIFI
jgi:hypothetical protein